MGKSSAGDGARKNEGREELDRAWTEFALRRLGGKKNRTLLHLARVCSGRPTGEEDEKPSACKLLQARGRKKSAGGKATALRICGKAN